MQPPRTGVKLLEGGQFVITGGDPAQPGIRHRGVGARRFPKEPQRRGRIGVDEANCCVEPASGDDRGIPTHTPTRCPNSRSPDT